MTEFKQHARPLSMTFCVVALIIAGVSEAFGYPFPRWLITFCLAYVGEWSIERGIRKGKGGE